MVHIRRKLHPALMFVSSRVMKSIPSDSLFGVDLTGEYLRSADLRSTDLRSVIFRRADLSRSSFVGAQLDNADFEGAILSKADFRLTSGVQCNFRRAVLTGWVDFQEADLQTACFDQAKILGDFSRSNLKGSVFRQSCLGGGKSPTTFLLADLRSAIFDEAFIISCSFEGADLRGADFSKVASRTVTHSGRVALSDSLSFFGALFDDSTIWPLGFDPISRGLRRV